MLEAKDSGIMLFGSTIELPEISVEAALSDTGLSASFLSVDSPGDDTPMKEQSCSSDPLPDESDLNGDGAQQESKDSSGGSNDGNTEEDGGELGMSNKLTETNGICQNSDSATVDDVAASSVAEEEHSEGSHAQDKTLKKPDKILPCPRCNSMDTKFCYYNNYNVNQPRYYCKNCQRYWTAGGSMRNMAIGAGRRKNKNLASLCRQAQTDLPNGVHHPTLKSDCTVNSNFCSDTPIGQSMASELNITDKSVDISARNWFQGPEKLSMLNHYGNINNVENPVPVVLGSVRDEARNGGPPEELVTDSHSIPPTVAWFSGSPWPYPWDFVQWTSPASPVVYRPSGYPMPFYPAPPFWGCTLPGVWSVPPCMVPPIPRPNSPTLGKHPRDDTTSKLVDSEKEQRPKVSNPEKCFWVPKTLRIDDPSEAARSSIWTTLGIKNDRKTDSVGSPLNAFESKGQVDDVPTAASVLRANPAALSRAVRFHESSLAHGCLGNEY